MDVEQNTIEYDISPLLAFTPQLKSLVIDHSMMKQPPTSALPRLTPGGLTSLRTNELHARGLFRGTKQGLFPSLKVVQLLDVQSHIGLVDKPDLAGWKSQLIYAKRGV